MVVVVALLGPVEMAEMGLDGHGMSGPVGVCHPHEPPFAIPTLRENKSRYDRSVVCLFVVSR